MDPTLMAQIMGTAPQMDQMQQGDQALADLIARRKAAAAQSASTGGGALLSGIADMIMGRKEGDLRQQHMDLANQLAQRRGQWGNDFMAAQQPSQAPTGISPATQIGTSVLADPNTALAPMQDRASAEQDRQQKLAGLKMQGMLSGDPLVTGYLEKAPGMAMEDMNLAKTREEMLANNSPEAGAANRILLKKFGFEMPETTPSATLRALIPPAEKGYAADQSREARIEAAKLAGASGRDRALIGQGVMPGTGGAGTPGQPMPLGGQKLDKALKELGADFDPNGGRAGEFGKNQARVNAAGRVLALATDENGNAKDLNPQQMPELAQSIASLISAGGQGAQSQIEHLTPKTLRGDFQRQMQWLTGNPRGADQVAFVQNMIETAKRERDQAQSGIDAVRKSRGAKHQRVLTSNPDESRKVLNGYGWDLGEDGLPVMAQPAPAPQQQIPEFQRVNGKMVRVK